MLWSDPSDEPPQELRDAETKMRRAGVVIAAAVIVVIAYVLGLL